MADRITIQSVAEALSQTVNVPKKLLDNFFKCFFEVIVEGLEKDGVVKIKGFGVFKLVEVGSRESVNVSNGERITIPGYKKVTFVAEDGVNDKLNDMVALESVVEDSRLAEDVSESAEALIVIDDEAGAADEEDSYNEESADDVDEENSGVEESEGSERESDMVVLDVNQDEAVDGIERPCDDFSGIDHVISTPESVKEFKDKLANARIRAKVTMEEACAAQAELRRLEKLVERIESYERVDFYAENKSSDASVNVTDGTGSTVNVVEEKKDVEGDVKKKKSNKVAIWILLPLILILSALGVYVYHNMNDVEGGKKVEKVVKKERAVRKVDTTKQRADENKKDTVGVDSMKLIESESGVSEKKMFSEQEGIVVDDTRSGEVENRPKASVENNRTHVVKRGETLTKISKKAYGTPDSVMSIIRLNKLRDPNNITEGMTLKLP